MHGILPTNFTALHEFIIITYVHMYLFVISIKMMAAKVINIDKTFLI